MLPVLRSLHSPDLGSQDLDTYRPPDADDFSVWVQAEVGPSDGPGSEIFGISVCSTKGLARDAASNGSKGFWFVRHRLVIDRWDTALIRRAIEDQCRRCSGATWREAAEKLGRYMFWEFEDYVG